MEKFVVSARKYRPQNFNSVIGQSHITTTLKNAISQNQLAHAFLFCGPRGVGKTTCARILAKTINCENRTPDNEACDQCNSCLSFNNGTSLNIHELDAASNNSVEDIRSLVEQVRFPPQNGNYKVYIIDEVHMLSSSAFNAFLKTLEEPPPYAIFILATTEKHKILPTILSRCQIFDFKRISPADIVEHLSEICTKEHVEANNAALHIIALKSEGCMRDALSMMDKIVSFTGGKLEYANTLEHLNILDEDYYFKLLNILLQENLPDALLLFEEINQKGFEGDVFLEGLSEFIRNILVSKDQKSVALLEVAEDFKPKFLTAAGNTSMGWLLTALNIISDALIQYKQSKNKKLLVELTLIKLAYLQQAIELTEDNSISKKKIADQHKVVAFRSLHSIQPLREKNVTQPEKQQVVHDEKPVYVNVQKPEKSTTTDNAEAVPVKQDKVKPVTAIPSISMKFIKEQHLNKLNEKQEVLEITDENLQECWMNFIDKISDKKNLSASILKSVVLLRINEIKFQIQTQSRYMTNTVEDEKTNIQEHIIDFYKNKHIHFIIEENIVDNPAEPQELELSPHEQYIKLLQKYPLISFM
jgi:DNA polymerase-3 subunit gamma/tau